MQQFLNIPKVALALIAIVFAGCTSKPPVPAASAAEAPAVAAPAKVAKHRTVVTKVPVLVKESSFYPDGLPDEYIVYKLDDAKKNVVEKDTLDTSQSDPIQRTVSEYKNGLLAAESVYESNGKLRSRRELGYDASGHMTQERMLDAKGAVQSSSAYEYDAQGRRTVWQALDSSGSAKATSTYTYGKDGLVGVVLKDAGGNVTGRITLEYADGKLAKRSYLGADGSLQKFEAYLYADGLLSAIEYHRADGFLGSKTAYSYDPSGELVKSVEYDDSGKTVSYTTYEYVVREDSVTETYYE
jgi:hypothetical protein